MAIELVKLPFDQHQKYRDIKEVLSIIKEVEQKETVKILLNNNDKAPSLDFLTTEVVTAIDSCNGESLPFADEDFDISIIDNVIEKIPHEQLRTLVQEMLRVTNKYIIIIDSTDNGQNVLADQLFFEYKKMNLNIEQDKIQEQLANGLTKTEGLLSIVKESGFDYHEFPIGNIVNWLFMNSLKFQLSKIPNSEQFQTALDEFYNKALYESDHREPSYRKVIVISKQNNKECLSLVEKRFETNNIKNVYDTENVFKTFKTMIDFSNNNFQNYFIEQLDYLNQKIVNKETEIDKLELECTDLKSQLNLIRNSKGWRILEKLRRIRNKIMGRSYPIQSETFSFKGRTLNVKQIEKDIKSFKYTPKISIVMPVYNIEEKLLTLAIKSVQEQLYDNWELCICDDASTKNHIKPLLKKFEEADKRIKVYYSEKNQGISVASNNAISLASGEFVALLDNDDELTRDALYEVVKLLQVEEADMIYSDEDKIDHKGNFCTPFFKPDWSPDLFLSMNYTSHLGVYRKAIMDEIGGFREGYDGCQDYDLVLRFTEKTDKIFHIPKILYHWRMIPGSTAEKDDAKAYTLDSAQKALKEAMERRNIDASIEQSEHCFTHYRVKRKIIGEPKISIIIPTKDGFSLLKRTIESIEKKSTYKNYEIIIVDNNSEDYKTVSYLEVLSRKYKVIKYPYAFNYSKINNFAAKQATGEYLLFLNNDVEVISDEWLEAMLEHAQRPEVGAVGAKLLYPDNRIQHAGVIIGIGGVAGHSQKKFRDNYLNKPNPGYFGFLNVVRNYSAVTAACLMTRKQVFEEIGGFNEENLAVSFNDVDLCLRIREKGYLIVYTPYTKLYHYESATRSKIVDPAEVGYMLWRWKEIIQKGDPYYNPNLSLIREDFSLK